MTENHRSGEAIRYTVVDQHGGRDGTLPRAEQVVSVQHGTHTNMSPSKRAHTYRLRFGAAQSRVHVTCTADRQRTAHTRIPPPQRGRTYPLRFGAAPSRVHVTCTTGRQRTAHTQIPPSQRGQTYELRFGSSTIASTYG